MYRVKAIPRAGHTGRNRAGRRFETAHWTELPADISAADLEAIRADPLLIVERVGEGTSEPSELEQLRADNASLRGQLSSLHGAVQEAKGLLVELDGLPALKAELQGMVVDVQRLEAANAALVAEAAELRSELERVTAERDALQATVAELAARATADADVSPADEATPVADAPAKKVLQRKPTAEK